MFISQSLAHGLDILLLFDVSSQTLTVSEISRRLGTSQSKTYRLVRTFLRYGFLQEDRGTARYGLGLNTLRLGLLAQKRLDLASFARPFMKELSLIAKETVLLTVVNGTRGVCLERIESEEVVRSSTYQPGESIPLHGGASGKILMAFLHEEDWDRIIAKEELKRYTKNTITQVHQIKNHLREIRRKGYAMSDREVYEDVMAVSAPILNDRGELVAGLSVVGPVYRMNKRKMNFLVRLVVEYAKKISNKLYADKPVITSSD